MPVPKRRSWPKWLFLILVLIGAAGFWRWRSAKTGTDKVEFKTAAVDRGDIVQVVTANGQITPVKNVQVGSQVSGIIREIFVDFNSRVTNGQVIAKIDPSQYEQIITRSKAELENSRAALLYAQLNHKRAKELNAADLMSASEYDKTVADLQQAEAAVKTREASLSEAMVNLERTTIYAPDDGVVISRSVDVGQTVAASFNTPTLFQIAHDLRKMRIEALVSEADVGGVEEGQDVTFQVDAFPARQFHGKVSQVRFAPITNQNVVNYTAIVDVDNSDLKLRPGMTATANLITAQRNDAIRVSNTALRFRPTDNMLGKAGTNSAAGAAGTNRTAMASTSGSDAPGGGNRDEMRRRMENMSPEEREAARARWQAMGGAGGPGGRRRPQSLDGTVTRTLYILESSAAASGTPTLKPVTVKLGISDGNYTEVLDGLKEGDQVVTGVNSPIAAAAAGPQQGTTPFGSPFGGGMRRGSGGR